MLRIEDEIFSKVSRIVVLVGLEYAAGQAAWRTEWLASTDCIANSQPSLTPTILKLRESTTETNKLTEEVASQSSARLPLLLYHAG